MYSGKRWATLLALVMVASMVLVACGPTSTPVVLEKVVTEQVPVVETVIVAGTSQVVEKPVEVEKVITATPEPKEKTQFTFCRYMDAVIPDPVMNDANADIWYMQQYYAGLVSVAPDNSLRMELAESWDVSDDGLTYTYHLRPNLKFSDGSPITPEDWLWSLERARDQNNGIWWFTFEAVDSIEADETKVVFHLKEPYVPFQFSPALFNAVVMPKAQVEAAGGWEKFMEHPIGAGPYIMTEWVRGDHMLLERNPYYWEEGKPILDEIYVRTIVEDNTRILALQKGDCDAINYPPFNRVADLQRDPNLVIHQFPSTYTNFITLNNRRPPLDNVLVRQALSYAIDRQAMINTINFGVGEPATTWRPRGSLYYNYDLEGWPYNPDKAKELLAEAGYPDGFKTTMEIVSGRESHQQIATMVKDMWARVGVDVEIQPLESGLYQDNYYNNNFDVHLNGWTDDIPDPSQSTNYAMVNATSESFHTGFQSDEVDQLAADALKEIDPAKRESIYLHLQEIFNEQVPFIPMWHEPYLVITRTGVKGFYQTPLGIYIWRDLDILR